jgi:hypothetical protein
MPETIPHLDHGAHDGPRASDTTEEWNGIQLVLEKDRERPRLWCDVLTKAFEGIVRGLCEREVLEPRFDGLADELAPLDAEALIAERGADGASVLEGVIEEHWNRGTEIDVRRLLAALKRGERHTHKTDARWGVIRSAKRTRLVWPLVLEGFRVDVAYLAKPKWAVTRYWLTVDLGARGVVEDVAVRTEEDLTWSTEWEGPEEGSMLGERVSETAYGAIEFVMGFGRYD